MKHFHSVLKIFPFVIKLEYTFFCFLSVSEDAAAIWLETSLQNYSSIVDDQSGLNNYWNEFNLVKPENTTNDPRNWKSGLKDPKMALNFLKPLPCVSDPTLPCKNKNFSERDLENFEKFWKNSESSPRVRKVPNGQEPIKNVSDNKEEKTNRPLFQNQTVTTNLVSEKNLPPPFVESKKQKNFSNSRPEPLKPQQFQKLQKPPEPQKPQFSGFKTARTELGIQQAKKNNPQPIKKSLGGKAVNSPYVNPFQAKKEEQIPDEPSEPVDERLKNIEPKMIELIKNEIMDIGKPVSWDDIAGLENVKQVIKEIVVFPMLRPDIFTGLRRPPKGILLFGPPGTGKTLIGKCIAAQSKSTFFSISASSLTSKWIGEGEKMVRALFAVARVEQPSVVFIDEIDSLLCQRSETEHESSRRMKTEFLIQLDGATTGDEDRILVIGATNRPYELDEAARRRLVKRLYVPLPELEARAQIVRNLLRSENHDLSDEYVLEIARLADGYSGADMTNLCKEASMGPIRSIPFSQLESFSKDEVRHVTVEDFRQALQDVRPSVSQKDLKVYLDWDLTYGSASRAGKN